MEDAGRDRKQQLCAQGWQGGGLGLGEENQHPGAKITAEITLLRCPRGGGRNEGKVGRCSGMGASRPSWWC